MSHQNAGEDNLAAMTNAWSAMTRGFLRTATAANRAAVSAMLPTIDGESGSETNRTALPILSVEYSDLDWQFDRTVDDPDHISVGDTVTFEKALTDADVRAFAAVSGDTNRSTSTTSSPPIPASASASSTEHSSPGSSAPPSLGSPDSPSTSHKTSSSAAPSASATGCQRASRSSKTWGTSSTASRRSSATRTTTRP